MNKYYKEEIQFPQWLMDHHTWWPYMNGALQLAAVAAAVIPVLMAKFYYGAPLHILELILVVIGFAAAAPFFMLAWFWHPCPVHTSSNADQDGDNSTTVHPRPPQHSVDVCVTLYKEDLDVIRGTLQACQKIECGSSGGTNNAVTVKIYALDDGNRSEVAEICEEINTSVGCVHPIEYVTRETNRGRKGGNLNDWLDKYAAVASEFFIVLDADMQPYPDMVEAFLGHYHGFSKDVQESIAYIQTPQHFCNHVPFFDVYDIDMAVLYKTMFVPMDKLGVTMCFGTGTFWRRLAVTSCGGFDEVCATEDCVTGCKVHKANNRLEILNNSKTQESSSTLEASDVMSDASPKKETTSTTAVVSTTTAPNKRSDETQWISKFLKRPVAVGISPRNLPELFDQRLRWAVAAIEATTTHRCFLFTTGLSWSQKMVYWATCGYWFYGILAFIVQVFGSITILYFIGMSGAAAANEVEEAPIWTSIIPMVSAIAYVAILPIASIKDKLASIPMFFTYTPVYVCAMLKHLLGVPISVQHTCAEGCGEEGKQRYWHWMFSWHLLALTGVACGAVVAGVYCEPTLMNYMTLIIQVGLWVGFYFPVYISVVTRAQADKIVYWYGGNEACVGV